tara:strand:+ start:228 stop:1049 length:822 start_codon:yes stop_codon:yes gene_type:complete
LPALGIVGRKSLVHDEHVIPRAVCGNSPAEQSDCWRLTSEVHLDCDKELKRNFDEVYEGFQHTLGNDQDSWVEQKLVHIANNLGELKYLEDGQLVGTIGGVDTIVDAVWCWVRGLHAFLHSVFLPPSSPRMLIPPMRSFLDTDPRSLLEQNEELVSFRSTFSHMVLLGKALNKHNSIKCWGGQVQFYSVWIKPNIGNQKKRKMYNCFWVLIVPGLEEMTNRMMGEFMPWVGMYSSTSLPSGSKCLSRGDVLQNTEYLESIKLPGSLMEIINEV